MSTLDVSIETNPAKGIVLCLLCYFLISLMGICEKGISSAVPIGVILFFQSVIPLCLILPEAKRKGWAQLKVNHVNTYIVRIASGLSCFAVLFYLMRFIPISEALLYQYSASLWIPLIMLWWQKSRMPRNLWCGILVGFVGITIIIKPATTALGIISLLGVCCGILQAFSMIAVRKLSLSEPPFRIMFYYFLAATIVTFPTLLTHWGPLSWQDARWLLGVGLCTCFAMKLLIASLKYANATTLAPICYSSILYSSILAWIFWGEFPDAITLVGMFLVICGCFLSMIMSRRNMTVANDIA